MSTELSSYAFLIQNCICFSERIFIPFFNASRTWRKESGRFWRLDVREIEWDDGWIKQIKSHPAVLLSWSVVFCKFASFFSAVTTLCAACALHILVREYVQAIGRSLEQIPGFQPTHCVGNFSSEIISGKMHCLQVQQIAHWCWDCSRHFVVLHREIS